ncbi:hypothetical protein D3C81_1485830 [compost metagenome]
MPIPNTTGVATSTTAFRMMWTLRLPYLLGRPKCPKAFSTTTTEPSTISPIATAKPPSDIRLAEMPNWFMTKKVSSGVSIKVATTITDERISPRKTSKMTTTSATPSSKTLATVHSAASTSSLRS